LEGHTISTALVCASHSPLLHCYDKAPKDIDQLQSAFQQTAQDIKDFDPEIVFAFGSNHFNGFFLKMMRAFCVDLATSATADIGGYPSDLLVPKDALQCVEFLRNHDVDTAVSYDMTIDHAFSQIISEMLCGLDRVPVILIFINCITTPFVPFRRTRILGETLGAFAETLGKHVLFLGPGGISRHPTRYYPALGEGEGELQAWQISGTPRDGREPSRVKILYYGSRDRHCGWSGSINERGLGGPWRIYKNF
jgi:2,3-dihydroxyphenylpropionate 1,2-dioxygenase